MNDRQVVDLMETAERLEAVAEALEQAAERLGERQVALSAEAEERVGRIVATVESAREAELERRLAEAEARLAAVMASGANSGTAQYQSTGRKTISASMTSMLAKQGVVLDLGAAGTSIEAGSLDAALSSLSIEQRIAVKSELRRAGVLA